MDMKQETTIQTAKAAPAIGGALYASLTLNDIVAIVTIIYVVIQTGFLINKWFWAKQDRKKDKKNGDTTNA